jgi:hypothetical protein
LEGPIDIFKRRLNEEWLPAFCHDEARRQSTEGFKATSINVSEFDAENFMRALDGNIVKDSGGGRYRCNRSNAFEQLFWTGSKSTEPRSLTLWIEPIITIGTIARLSLDYGWQERLLGMQSKDWAFDLAVYEGEASAKEYIAGEVKKSEMELDLLIEDLVDFGQVGLTESIGLSQKRVNSFKKWMGLLRCHAPYFWAVGPNDYTHLFSVEYESDKTANFSKVKLDNLAAQN